MEKYPKISIVTPSLNQGNFIEKAITSVLDQKYNNLEYIIIDGGSNDNTIDIIKKYESQIQSWTSNPDNGQYDAINIGFQKSSGEIMAWLNSDDMYTPWALHVVAKIFQTFPHVQWITSAFPILWSTSNDYVQCFYNQNFNKEAFYLGMNLPGRSQYGRYFIQQESTFWRRNLWERAGGYIDISYKFAADFELWSRYFKYETLYAVESPIGGFRQHINQKTAENIEEYLDEAEEILNKYKNKICISQKKKCLWNILNLFLPTRLLERKKYYTSHSIMSYLKKPRWIINEKKFLID